MSYGRRARGPIGDTGPQGPIGPQGPAGEQGPPGISGQAVDHSHYYNRNEIDDMVVKYEKRVPIGEADDWHSQPYLYGITNTATTGLPGEIQDANEKYGVLVYLEDDHRNKTGIQIFYSGGGAGTRTGRVYTRKSEYDEQNFIRWTPWKKIAFADNVYSRTNIDKMLKVIDDNMLSLTAEIDNEVSVRKQQDANHTIMMIGIQDDIQNNYAKKTDLTLIQDKNATQDLMIDTINRHLEHDYLRTVDADIRYVRQSERVKRSTRDFDGSDEMISRVDETTLDLPVGFTAPHTRSGKAIEHHKGILIWFPENTEKGNNTGIQMIYPIDGDDVEGVIYIRGVQNGVADTWKKVDFLTETEALKKFVTRDVVDELLDSKVGPQGPAGPQGATGPTGATGPQGPAGESVDYSRVYQKTEADTIFLKNQTALETYIRKVDAIKKDYIVGSHNETRTTPLNSANEWVTNGFIKTTNNTTKLPDEQHFNNDSSKPLMMDPAGRWVYYIICLKIKQQKTDLQEYNYFILQMGTT